MYSVLMVYLLTLNPDRYIYRVYMEYIWSLHRVYMKSTWSICTVYMEYAVSYTEPHILMVPTQSEDSLQSSNNFQGLCWNSLQRPYNVSTESQYQYSPGKVLTEFLQSPSTVPTKFSDIIRTMFGLCKESSDSIGMLSGLHWDCIGTVLELYWNIVMML